MLVENKKVKMIFFKWFLWLVLSVGTEGISIQIAITFGDLHSPILHNKSHTNMLLIKKCI